MRVACALKKWQHGSINSVLSDAIHGGTGGCSLARETRHLKHTMIVYSQAYQRGDHEIGVDVLEWEQQQEKIARIETPELFENEVKKSFKDRQVTATQMRQALVTEDRLQSPFGTAGPCGGKPRS